MENLLNTEITKEELDKFISKHLNPYTPFFMTLSGAHIYGFPSSDSDLDLRGAYLFDKETLLNLWDYKATTVQSPIEKVQGIELDLVCHEISKYVGMIFSGEDGTVLEQIFSPEVIYQDEKFEHFKKIIRKCYITKKLYNHYSSFTRNKIEEFKNEKQKKLKTILYALRVAHTGIHLFKSGQIETNLKTLNAEMENLDFINDLITRKIEEQTVIKDAKEIKFLTKQAEEFLIKLEKAHNESNIPDNVRNRYKLERELPVFYSSNLFDRAFKLAIMKSPYDEEFINNEKQKLLFEISPLASLEKKLDLRICPKKLVYVPNLRKFFSAKNRKDIGRDYEFVDVERFILHLTKSNPFSLLALYQAESVDINPELDEIRKNTDKIITKAIYNPFKNVAATLYKKFTESEEADYDASKAIIMLTMLIHGRYALENGTISFNYSNQIKFLNDVASQKASKQDIIDKYKILLERYEKAYKICKLPLDQPDRKYLSDCLAKIKTDYWLKEI